ncbi:MAG: hypothetical protein A2580_17885 [Hydrogenophilales bacterium RIFOXYD1_FULL_62_11]|nr:MAG: hypothetical protein A2580_17885 [Hydrogenophilales bacterium RIFOXYD1_FULL_62_11]
MAAGLMDDAQAGIRLRQATGRQWTLLTAIQYLTGKEAIAALRAIPADQAPMGLSHEDRTHAIALAVSAAAGGARDGGPLCASHLVALYRAHAGASTEDQGA